MGVTQTLGMNDIFESPTQNSPLDLQRLSIGVLVLNYNTWNLALRALNAAIAFEEDAVAEYVLFDDGSQTPAPSLVDSRIRVVHGKPNRGFAAALNIAFAEMRSDIIVLFDSDAYPIAPFADCVRKRFAEDEQLGQLGFFSQNHSGSLTESFTGEPTQWSLLLGQRLYARIPQGAVRTSDLCIFTSCMATRMVAYREIGGFDGKFDWLDVDLDYSIRLRQGGWRVATDPSLKAVHEGSGTPQLQRHRVLRYYKSRWYLLRKHNQITNARLARFLIVARLRAERLGLHLFGKFLFRSPQIRAEKILGRKELISYCRTHLC